MRPTNIPSMTLQAMARNGCCGEELGRALFLTCACLTASTSTRVLGTPTAAFVVCQAPRNSVSLSLPSLKSPKEGFHKRLTTGVSRPQRRHEDFIATSPLPARYTGFPLSWHYFLDFYIISLWYQSCYISGG